MEDFNESTLTGWLVLRQPGKTPVYRNISKISYSLRYIYYFQYKYIESSELGYETKEA
jgi:hypothetical protein